MSKLHLVLLIHAHQPVGNFDHVLEEAYTRCYAPFLEVLAKHPTVRLGLHFSGALLEWMEKHHADFFDRLRELVKRGQAEMVGGGFYEPILVSIPPEDRLEQIRRLADYLEKHAGQRPTGAWLAERVWEPQLANTLAQAGVDYTLLDDSHFLSAGYEPRQLHGYYLTEDLGATVKLIPGLQKLRYLIPFRGAEENIAYLKEVAAASPGGMAAMGDDCEKFGVWPGTYEWCYGKGWLESFFTALESNADWLVTTPPGEYLATHAPLGQAALAAGSYMEMGEWALFNEAQSRYHALQQEFAARADLLLFLRGGFWRNFLVKYGESNLLHKKMLHVAGKLRGMETGARRGLPFKRALADARRHLLRAQCNDAYWHGIFGGLYSPHLRTALWQELIRAEKVADAAAAGHASYAEVTRFDFDADGAEEAYVVSDTFAALVKPSDGGTMAALDFRPADVALINSLQRRAEASHAKLKEAQSGEGGKTESIHDRVAAKESDLAGRIRHDRWPRHCFRLLLFPLDKLYRDYEQVRLEESATFAGSPYALGKVTAETIALSCAGELEAPGMGPQPGEGPVRAKKTFSFARGKGAFSITCDVALTQQLTIPLRMWAGIEVVLNFLAPDAQDRYFEIGGSRKPLQWAGAAPASILRLVDEWQNVAATVEAPSAREFWVAPVETVSISEEGFERVYQGSQILAVWPLEIAAGGKWEGRVVLRVGLAR